MKLAHPIAVIFGAGATRGALEKVSDPPPPLDNDFFDIAGQLRGHGTPALARRVLKSVWELYRKVSGISLEQYYRDVETRATIGQFAKTANQPKDWTRRRHALEELIRRVYIHTTCDMSGGKVEPRKSDLHKTILGNLGNGDTIITFNYDLVIEESFDLKPSWNPIEGYGDRAQGRTFDWCRNWLTDHKIQDSRKSTKLIILKLHGSLNWTLYRNKKIRLKPHPFVVRTRTGRPSVEKVSVLPPGWNKRIDRNPYKLFWRQARLRLEKCKTLVIIGYSLPETDLLAQALFAEVVRTREARKVYLKQLHVADPDQVVKDRFIKLFRPALYAHGMVFKYQNLDEFVNKCFSTNGAGAINETK